MKATLVALLSLLFLGCGARTSEIYANRDYQVGETREATVGSVMMSWEVGTEYKQYKTTYKTEGVRKELLYGGIAQGVIQVTYREFYVASDFRGTEGTARQPFYQDVKYDLSGSKQITFRDIKLKIESADQNKIVFTILQEPAEVRAGNIKQMGRLGFKVDPNTLIITDVLRDGPADRYGVKAGDRLIKIDNEPVSPGDEESVLSRLAGNPGTNVTITVRRDTREYSFTARRAKIMGDW